MFVGGNTLQLSANKQQTDGRYDWGTFSAPMTWSDTAGAYQLTFQVGNMTGGSSVGALNGLHIALVPEPATMAMLAMGGVAALIRRRR